MKSQKRFALCIARNLLQIPAHVQRARSVVHTGQPCFPCGQQVFKKYLKLKILMCFIWAAHLWLSTLASLYSAASHACGERVCPHFEKRIFTWEKRWANELHSERHGHRGHRPVGGALRSVLLKALRSPLRLPYSDLSHRHIGDERALEASVKRPHEMQRFPLPSTFLAAMRISGSLFRGGGHNAISGISTDVGKSLDYPFFLCKRTLLCIAFSHNVLTSAST